MGCENKVWLTGVTLLWKDASGRVLSQTFICSKKNVLQHVTPHKKDQRCPSPSWWGSSCSNNSSWSPSSRQHYEFQSLPSSCVGRGSAHYAASHQQLPVNYRQRICALADEGPRCMLVNLHSPDLSVNSSFVCREMPQSHIHSCITHLTFVIFWSLQYPPFHEFRLLNSCLVTSLHAGSMV